MLEGLIMISAIAAMGIYMVKSAELPKELKERQVILEQELKANPLKKKYRFDKVEKKVAKTIEVKKVELKINKELIDQEINELTFKITSLEQEIRENNQRNNEILLQINTHLKRLEELNQLRNA